MTFVIPFLAMKTYNHSICRLSGKLWETQSHVKITVCWRVKSSSGRHKKCCRETLFSAFDNTTWSSSNFLASKCLVPVKVPNDVLSPGFFGKEHWWPVWAEGKVNVQMPSCCSTRASEQVIKMRNMTLPPYMIGRQCFISVWVRKWTSLKWSCFLSSWAFCVHDRAARSWSLKTFNTFRNS